MSVFYSSRPLSEAFFRVHTAAQAAVLDDRGTARFFYPFLGKEKSVALAAVEVGCKLNAMHYRVKTFLEAGLLRVVREEKRAGRPVKVYRSVADAFFVPFQLTPHITQQESWLAHIEPVARRIAQSMVEQHLAKEHSRPCFFRDNRDDLVVIGGHELSEGAIVFHPDASYRPLGTDRSGNIFLTEDKARGLEHDLIDLFSRSGSGIQTLRAGVSIFFCTPSPRHLLASSKLTALC